MARKWEPLGDDYPGAEVQVAQVGGRTRIVGVRVENDDGVTLQQLQIPIHRLEARLREKPSMRMTLPEGGWPPPKRHELVIRAEYFENPDGRGYGQEMYERVAMLYSRCVAGGIRPAPAIAEANDVPETTVRRWIREARRRGVLAPARTPGRYGMSVRQRGKNNWEYMFDAGVDPATGKRRRQSKSGFRTEREGKAAEREAMRAVDRGVTAPGEAPTVATLAAEYLARRRPSLRPSTWDSYRDVLEGRVVPGLGALRSDRVTERHVADFTVELGERGGHDTRRGPGLSAQTVRYTLSVLSRVFNDAVKRGVIPRNPCEHVDRPRVTEPETSSWNVAEARTFLNYTADDRLSALWTLLLTTGLRRGEALGLKWDDLDMDAGRLAVRRALVSVGYRIEWSEPKTAASRRVVALDSGTVAALKAHRSRQFEERLAVGSGYLDQELVFCAVAGEPLHPDGVTQRFDRLVRDAGVHRIRLHDTRHTAATLMLEQGVPLKVVTERLGHSSTRITADLYQHATEHMQNDAAARLGAALLGRP